MNVCNGQQRAPVRAQQLAIVTQLGVWITKPLRFCVPSNAERWLLIVPVVGGRFGRRTFRTRVVNCTSRWNEGDGIGPCPIWSQIVAEYAELVFGMANLWKKRPSQWLPQVFLVTFVDRCRDGRRTNYPRANFFAGDYEDRGKHRHTRSTQLMLKTTLPLRLIRCRSQNGSCRLNASVRSASVLAPRLHRKSRDAQDH